MCSIAEFIRARPLEGAPLVLFFCSDTLISSRAVQGLMVVWESVSDSVSGEDGAGGLGAQAPGPELADWRTFVKH